ncbi:MAG: response regulator transcription factor [Microscillaceae bacterium]|jgi:DNA-binding response OmpR family regulator|nr:response regulator transcription factor [Microscillaceae bacterium]
MKKAKTKILLAEDDQNLGMLLQDYLEMEGFEVRLCRDGEDGYKAFQNAHYDICILDVMMPKKDGFSLAKDIRSQDNTIPILFLTAKALTEDKIQGFQIGADDYITKPFNEEELVYRIKAILKRTSILQSNEEKILKLGKYTFDYEKQELIFGKENRRITSRESEILRLLILKKDNVLKREDALIAIWGENDYFHGRSFDVFITKLRKYLKNDPNLRIENIHGVGFMLTDKP